MTGKITYECAFNRGEYIIINVYDYNFRTYTQNIPRKCDAKL